MSSYKEYTQRVRHKRVGSRATVLAMLLLITLLTIALAYVASRMLTGRPLFDPIQLSNAQSGILPGNTEGENTQNPDPGAVLPNQQLERAWNVMERQPVTVNQELVSVDAKMLALPRNGRVSRDFFKTAMFIGDSLAQGMGMYPGQALQSEGTVVAAFKGTSPKLIVQNGMGELPDKTSVPMLDYIQQQNPTTIYICIGTNALIGEANDEAFLKYYGDLLDVVKQSFPEVPIYVHSILPVTAETSQRKPVLDNDRIRLINNSVALMALDRGMYYLNLHEVLADETGALREDIAGGDGIHMRDGVGYEIWVDYLQTHTAYNAFNVQFLEEIYQS